MPGNDNTPDNILGEEFLTWLWYKSEAKPDSFKDSDGTPFSVYMEQRIVVQGGDGQARETASASGSLSALREAKFGLLTGKKVTRAIIRLEKDEMAFQLALRAEDFCLGSVRTPKVERGEDDDPDAPLLEKIYLLEQCAHMLDILYRQFLHLRISGAWTDEVRHIGDWLRNMANARQ